MLTPCNMFRLHLVIQMCLCLFFILGIKRRKKKILLKSLVLEALIYSILTLLSCCLLLLSLILHSSRDIQLAENVNEYLLFLLVPFCVCIHVALSPFISQFRACLFLYIPCNVPSHFYCFIFFAHVFVYMQPQIPNNPNHHVVCPFLSFKTLCAFLCLFSLFAGTVC